MIRFIKAFRIAVRMTWASSFLHDGRARKAKEILLGLQSELDGNDIEFHLMMANANQDLGDFSACYEQLGLARDILDSRDKLNTEEKKYLLSYIIKRVLDIKGDDISAPTKLAFLEVKSQVIDYSLVRNRFVSRYPLDEKLE